MLMSLLWISGQMQAQQTVPMFDTEGSFSGDLHVTELVLPESLQFDIRREKNGWFCSPCMNPEKNFPKDSAEVVLRTTGMEGFNAASASIYNVADGIINIDFKNQATEVRRKVAKGTYDMYVRFKGPATYYVFKEKVDISGDTSLVFRQSDATHPLTFRYLDEKGQELKLDLYNVKGQKIEDGTADMMTKLSYFVLKELGCVASVVGRGYMPLEYPMDFFVNDVSDRYMLLQGAIVTVGKTRYLYKHVVTDFTQKSVQNNPEDLRRLVQKFKMSPVMEGEKNVHFPGVYFSTLYKGVALIGQRSYKKSAIQDIHESEFYLCTPESDEKTEDRFNVTLTALYSDYREMNGNDEKYLFTRGTPVLGDKDGLHYVYAGYDQYGGFNIPVDGKYGVYHPGHPAFSFTDTQEVPLYGNNAPICSFKARNYTDEKGFHSSKSLCYVGRYGEVRETDAHLFTQQVSSEPDGDFVNLTITNTNIDVDGVPGKNVTVVRYNERQTDGTAPTLQMLQFRDRKGRITDRFEHAVDGVMKMAGGDFNYVYDKAKGKAYFECGGQTACVSVSPYGKDEWQELDVEEIREMFFMPAFGYFYRVPLDEVRGKSPNGYFDVRIVLTDKSGNSQTQTVSPAFWIGEAVDTAVDDGEMVGPRVKIEGKTVFSERFDAVSTRLYTVEGTMVAHSHMNNITANTPGLYVFKSVDRKGRCLVEKVNIR